MCCVWFGERSTCTLARLFDVFLNVTHTEYNRNHRSLRAPRGPTLKARYSETKRLKPQTTKRHVFGQKSTSSFNVTRFGAVTLLVCGRNRASRVLIKGECDDSNDHDTLLDLSSPPQSWSSRLAPLRRRALRALLCCHPWRRPRGSPR